MTCKGVGGNSFEVAVPLLTIGETPTRLEI
jgi:hypothetical protein